MKTQQLPQSIRRATTNEGDGIGFEDRVAMALEEYAAAADAGQPISKESLLAKYADVADELAGCLDSLDFIHQVAPQLHDDLSHAVKAAKSEIRPLATLGDFRIVREIGRGGMGVVYEAEQLSLGRRVALKVLPFAAMLGDQQLKRFRNEARAAATLDHPNIVAIYSVGVDRGVHYYAMQLVDGQNLAQLIDDMRRERGQVDTQSAIPGTFWVPQSEIIETTDTAPVAALSTLPEADSSEYYRTIARLGIQAAEALEHAHQQGILHRDIKPANLLVDTIGKLWVTDFGLARVEADATMTMTGDLLGTLRYMSPEQALAKRAVVDHSTDIYSLGVTLYELLTLHPAFPGVDRQELLRQIAIEDPRPLRQINAFIPRALETIVLKAIEKTPADRYATAGLLADDLNRFLTGRTIAACRPNLAQRVAKWLKRNPTIAATTALVLGMLFVLALIGTVIVGRAWAEALKAQRQTAVQRDRFLGERDTALHNLYIADVRLAHQEWDSGHLASFDNLLDSHIPPQDQPDFRGWEWYYLKSLGQREVATLTGHTADVDSVAWSPDGRWLASGGRDFTVRLWDAATCKLRATLCGHTAEVKAVAWSPDGLRLASSGWDNTLRVWDAATEKTLLTIPTGFAWVARNVVWSPEGGRIASCGDLDGGEGLAKVWDARTGKELLQMKGPSGLVWGLAWSPDGKRIASTGNYDAPHVRIWDANAGTLIREIKDASTAGAATVSVSWSCDGKRLAAANRDNVQVWDAESWRSLWRVRAHPGRATSIEWSPDSQSLASAGLDGKVRLWNVRGQIENTLRGHRDGVYSIDWRPDGQLLASASADHTLKIWAPERNQAYSEIKSFSCARWDPSSARTLAVLTKVGEDELLRLDLLSGSSWNTRQSISLPLRSADFANPAGVGLNWSHDGKWLAVGYSAKEGIAVTVVERATGAEVMTLKEPDAAFFRQVAWSPVAPQLAVAAGNQAIIWDLTAGEKTARLNFGLDHEGIDSVAWSPDGSQLAVSSWDQQLAVYETEHWRQMARLNRHPEIRALDYGGDGLLAWNPDGTVLAAGTGRGWVIMWDASNWRESLSFSAHAAGLRSIAFNPAGYRLATVGNDGVVKMWDANDGAHLLTLHAGDYELNHVSWSSDGTCVLATAWTQPWVWDASAAMMKPADIQRPRQNRE